MGKQKADLEAEGLLDGLEGETRKARARLLARLADDGVSVEELRRAIAEDRLVLVPVERAPSPSRRTIPKGSPWSSERPTMRL